MNVKKNYGGGWVRFPVAFDCFATHRFYLMNLSDLRNFCL